MTTRIVDVAHTAAAHHTPAGPHQDLDAARQAVATGLDVDDAAELIHGDRLRLGDAAGNRPWLHTAVCRVQRMNRALGCSPGPETEQLVNDPLSGPNTAQRNMLEATAGPVGSRAGCQFPGRGRPPRPGSAVAAIPAA
ncbi:hypothetical protein ACSR0Z_38085 [Streptomyces viridosporus]|nr:MULTISPECIES: hypothetical protein [Streptomyces]